MIPINPGSRVGHVVDADTGCWIWTGAVDRNGYGPRRRPAHAQDRIRPSRLLKVRTIRRLYVAGGITQTQLGAMFGVHNSIICDVVNRRSWREVA